MEASPRADVVATHDATIGTSLRPLISDFDAAGGALIVDSLTMTPWRLRLRRRRP